MDRLRLQPVLNAIITFSDFIIVGTCIDELRYLPFVLEVVCGYYIKIALICEFFCFNRACCDDPCLEFTILLTRP